MRFANKAIVVGVGPLEGTGGTLCLKLAAEGLHVFVVGRTREKLDHVAAAVREQGGTAEAFAADSNDPASVETLFTAVDGAPGDLELVIYNVGNAAFGDLLSMEPAFFETVWRTTCFGGFLVGQQAGRRMTAQGSGTILFTGATASVKARPPFAAFASAKFALRGLAQAMARDWGPRGVHVAHVVIDGAIGGEKIKQG
jgi:NAD(P)-dependent dehydrogenase (short-subunit alcohol dehydrogenase family)